jgi:hypothetical protein
MKILLNISDMILKLEKTAREEDFRCVERNLRCLLRFKMIFTNFCSYLCIFYMTHFFDMKFNFYPIIYFPLSDSFVYWQKRRLRLSVFHLPPISKGCFRMRPASSLSVRVFRTHRASY